MALLWHSATWRAIVRATRNPYVFAAFFAASTAGATGLAWASQAVTDAVAANTLEELEEMKGRDFDTARYAQRSKAALADVLAGARGEEPKAGLKLPPIQWHPGAVEREERQRRRRVGRGDAVAGKGVVAGAGEGDGAAKKREVAGSGERGVGSKGGGSG